MGYPGPGSPRSRIQLWAAAGGRQIRHPLPGFSGPAYVLAFSPNGKTLASGNAYGTVLLWDAAARHQIEHRLATSQTDRFSPVTSLTFSPDSKTLATANSDGGVRLWTVATGRQMGNPLIGHDGPVGSVAFSPDGKTLASLGADGVVRLWDIATQQQITALTGHTSPALPGQPSPVDALAFSPDGKTLVSASADHIVQLWNVSYLVGVVPHLCATAARSLTPQNGHDMYHRARGTRRSAPEHKPPEALARSPYQAWVISFDPSACEPHNDPICTRQ
jgi:WD40 repeat protein